MTTHQGPRRRVPTVTHWGNYLVDHDDEKILDVLGYPDDPHPSPIGQALADSRDPRTRIAHPMVRKGYLDQGWQSKRTGRGREPFVAVSWDKALDLAAEALARVKRDHGNEAIYGGSYGWASAGRFHHTQSQLHRFLRHFGGYTDSDRTYSAAAAEVLLPHILGSDLYTLFLHTTPWSDVRDHGELVLCFSGVSPKNLQVVMGGPGAHTAPDQLRDCAKAGVRFINISPLRSDLPEYVEAEWIPIRPCTDAALMLALCHTLVEEGLHDTAFLERYTVGFEPYRAYLMGERDGQPKSAEWAAEITTVPAGRTRALARELAVKRTFIPIGWSLQRAEHGEQPFWASTVLMALLGQYGLPGAGVGHGVGSLHTTGFVGRRIIPFRWASLPQGENPVDAVIPVARVTDMLENPGQEFDYDGRKLRYPDIQLIYWAGGNPFHHHQDLNRLRAAWAKPGCVIVNEQVWTATARHADIVFPATTTLERNDLAFNTFDPYISPMRRAVPPFGQARDDYAIFGELARRLGFVEEFTEGRDEAAWLRHLFEESRARAAAHGVLLPDFETFWAGEHFSIAPAVAEQELIFEAFRRDPDRHPLGTPSGKIEIHSETIASFGYADCPGHPVWLDKTEWTGGPRAERYPLHLISNQPASRLHSQLDFGAPSRATKIQGREPLAMHPQDAEARGIQAGEVVRVYNDRGACLAGVHLTENIRPGVVQIATGAWFDPVDDDRSPGLCVHGNPNVLTPDIGTSRLGQGPSAHSCLVEIEAWTQPLPPVRAFSPPEIIFRD
ncbi:MAG: Asp-tRNA(Asn)/Glu-tRNA(Gln) amidotransferase GatCAB subunit C [Gammaproteobacteria bacterium]|nr:Asp-tRNA(Asn)/Glu-tRNA(Gln) amidotransferase GatCAB subunit C [Gammaproteobacteria bacterium]